jgi:hypothetical protein
VIRWYSRLKDSFGGEKMKKLAIGIGVLLLLAIVMPVVAEPAQVIQYECGGPGYLGTGQRVLTPSGHFENFCRLEALPGTPLPDSAIIVYPNENLHLMVVITPSGLALLNGHSTI